jgi:hypothetical protein
MVEEGSQKKKERRETEKRSFIVEKTDTKRGRVGAGPPGRRKKYSYKSGMALVKTSLVFLV